jgi:ribosomal protein S18 acetylase RimI-like enzyme
VLPAFRGRGIGAAMMTAMEEFAAAKGQGEARISVRVLLPKNVELYERLGYAVTARYQHDRGDELVVDMAKRLR